MKVALILLISVLAVISEKACVAATGTCPSNQVFSNCASPCKRSCKNRLERSACPQVCERSCTCPDGTVLNGVDCVPEYLCRKTPETTADRIRRLDPSKLTRCTTGIRASQVVINVADSQMTSSSNWGGHPASHGRLDFTIITQDPRRNYPGWVPAPDRQSRGEWLQVDFLKPTYITGIVTQGRGEIDAHGNMQYSTSFKIQYGNTLNSMSYIRDDYYAQKVFEGNYDHVNYVVNYFPQPITARYVRYITHTWSHFPTTRLEYLTC